MIQEQETILEEKKEEDIAKTTLRIPNNILRELKHISIDDNKTLTEIVVIALSEYLKKRGKKA